MSDGCKDAMDNATFRDWFCDAFYDSSYMCIINALWRTGGYASSPEAGNNSSTAALAKGHIVTVICGGSCHVRLHM